MAALVCNVLLEILAVRGVLYALCVLLGAKETTRESVLAGALYGSFIGVVLAPVAIVILMMVLHSLYGATFLGLEILAGPVIGAVACAIPGAIVAAIREKAST